jgi:hypothetical protein
VFAADNSTPALDVINEALPRQLLSHVDQARDIEIRPGNACQHA